MKLIKVLMVESEFLIYLIALQTKQGYLVLTLFPIAKGIVVVFFSEMIFIITKRKYRYRNVFVGLKIQLIQ